jgi:hypothetical protein
MVEQEDRESGVGQATRDPAKPRRYFHVVVLVDTFQSERFAQTVHDCESHCVLLGLERDQFDRVAASGRPIALATACRWRPRWRGLTARAGLENRLRPTALRT